MSELAYMVWESVLSCPHTITTDEVILRLSHSQDGNAASQIYKRIETTLSTLIEEQSSRIEELEQKLRTTSLEALAISDTNNELVEEAQRLRGLVSDSEKERYRVCAELLKRTEISESRLSEAVKVLERIAANYEDGATFSGTQCADIAKAFITTLGGENEEA